MYQGVVQEHDYIGDATNKIKFGYDYGEGVVADKLMIAKKRALTYLQLAEVVVCGEALIPTSLPSISPTTPTNEPATAEPSSKPTISSKLTIVPSAETPFTMIPATNPKIECLI